MCVCVCGPLHYGGRWSFAIYTGSRLKMGVATLKPRLQGEDGSSYFEATPTGGVGDLSSPNKGNALTSLCVLPLHPCVYCPHIPVCTALPSLCHIPVCTALTSLCVLPSHPLCVLPSHPCVYCPHIPVCTALTSLCVMPSHPCVTSLCVLPSHPCVYCPHIPVCTALTSLCVLPSHPYPLSLG